MKITAILSTTVISIDGTYKIETLKGENRAITLTQLTGIPHYVGHPDTKAIIEGLGAIPAPTKLFSGLLIGERALCFPIKQGLSDRGKEGFSSPHQAISEIGNLDIRLLTRIE